MALDGGELPLHPYPDRETRRLSGPNITPCGVSLFAGERRHFRRPCIDRPLAGGAAVGQFSRQFSLFLQSAGPSGLPDRAGLCESASRTRPCLYRDPLRLPRARYGCGISGDDAGAVYRHDRCVADPFATKATVGRLRGHADRTDGGKPLYFGLGVPARRSDTKRGICACDYQLGDEPSGQHQSLHAVRRLLCPVRRHQHAQSPATRLRSGKMAPPRMVVCTG